jgi:hypothetical protein
LLLAVESGDDTRRLRALSALSGSSYKEHVKQLRDRPNFSPWHAFSPIFMSTWFELFSGKYSLDDLTNALTTVAEHGSEGDREYVEALHKHLDADERLALGGWLKASPLHFASLQVALDMPASTNGDQAEKSRSLWRRFLHLFIR